MNDTAERLPPEPPDEGRPPPADDDLSHIWDGPDYRVDPPPATESQLFAQEQAAKLAKAEARKPKPQPETLLPVRSLSALRAEPPQEIDWLVDRLLPQDGVGLLTALPKAGKSTLARSLAHAVQSGAGKWLGHDCVSGRVIYLALEERARTVLDHLNRLNTPGDLLVVIGQADEPAKQIAQLRETVESLQPVLVVADTLADLIGRPVDFNSYGETTEALRPIQAIARAHRSHLLLVHHARKPGGDGGTDASGSTGIPAKADTHMSLTGIDGEQRYLTARGRDDVYLPKLALRYGDDGDVSAGNTKTQDDINETLTDILLCLDQESPRSRTGFKGQIRRAQRVIDAALKQGVADGGLLMRGSGKRGDPIEYERHPNRA